MKFASFVFAAAMAVSVSPVSCLPPTDDQDFVQAVAEMLCVNQSEMEEFLGMNSSHTVMQLVQEIHNGIDVDWAEPEEATKNEQNYIRAMEEVAEILGVDRATLEDFLGVYSFDTIDQLLHDTFDDYDTIEAEFVASEVTVQDLADHINITEVADRIRSETR